MHTPALSADAVTLGPGAVFEAAGGTVAALTAQQRVVAESLGLAHIAGRSDRLRGADAAPSHFVAQSAATLARCRGKQESKKEKKKQLFFLRLNEKWCIVHSRLQWGKP